MNWPYWNYLSALLLIVLHSILFTIFAHPWLQLAAGHWGFQVGTGSLWFFITALCSIGSVVKGTGRGKRGLFYLAGGQTLALGLGLLWNLPFFFVITLTLILLFAGVRFNGYENDSSFPFDWGWSTFVLLIALVLEERLGYSLGFSLILLYFVLGILAIILWNGKALEREGLPLSYGGLGRFIPLFVLGVGGFAAALGLILSPALLRKGLTLLGKLYDGVLEVLIFLVVKPFAWLMSPLFRWAERQELTLKMSQLEEFASERPLGEGASATTAVTVKAAASVGWVLLVAVLVLVAWLALRRILRQTKKQRDMQIWESRESVFSGEEVLNDFKRSLQNLVQPLTRLGLMRWYRGDDPILLIRTFYARFVTRARRKVAYHPGLTPEEYRGLVAGTDRVDSEALRILTTVYNRARYGELGDGEDANEAEQAFLKLRR